MKLNLKSHAKINLALNVTGKNKLLDVVSSIALVVVAGVGKNRVLSVCLGSGGLLFLGHMI